MAWPEGVVYPLRVAYAVESREKDFVPKLRGSEIRECGNLKVDAYEIDVTLLADCISIEMCRLHDVVIVAALQRDSVGVRDGDRHVVERKELSNGKEPGWS